MISKINQYIEIIFFMEKEDNSLRKFLEKFGVTKIFIDNTNSLEEIIQIIEKNTQPQTIENNLSLEIEKLKQIIENNQYYQNSLNNQKDNKLGKNNPKNLKKEFENKIIAVAGSYGSGKSLITAQLGKAAKQQNIHTLIVDFDIINNSINMLFKVPKYNNEYKTENYPDQCIRKVDKYLDIFCGIDLLFNEDNKISYEKVKELFENLRSKYDLILVDTSSETTLKYVKTVLLNCDKIIFLIEPNLLDIKKAENLLEIYIEDWEIPLGKFNIILNKVNSASIDDEILMNIFGKIKIIGKLNFSTSYMVFVNDTPKRKFSFK